MNVKIMSSLVCCVDKYKIKVKSPENFSPCVASAAPLGSARWQCYTWPIMEAAPPSIHPFSD